MLTVVRSDVDTVVATQVTAGLVATLAGQLQPSELRLFTVARENTWLSQLARCRTNMRSLILAIRTAWRKCSLACARSWSKGSEPATRR